MTLTQKFFDDYNRQTMQIFKQKMAKLTFRDTCYEQQMGDLLYAKLCVADQELRQFEIDDVNSRLMIDVNKQSLSLVLTGIDMLFDLKFDISSKPQWFQDSGAAVVRVKQCRITMDLKTLNKEGVLQIDFAGVKVSIDDYVVEVNGHTDLSRAVEIVFNSFKSFFREELVNMLAWRAAKSTEESLNYILFEQGEIMPLNTDRTIHLNATMISEPSFHEGFFTVAIDGTFLTSSMADFQPQSRL